MRRTFNENQTNLFAIAEMQGGFFTAKQAEVSGFHRTNHSYHVRTGKWEREHRGIYRLKQYPLATDSYLIVWSLWSRDVNDKPQGVYSHETALRIFDLSDIMPSKLQITVPSNFRRQAAIPAILTLHHAMLDPHDVEEREGYRVTRPARTISDLSTCRGFSPDLLKQAFEEARSRGLITSAEARFGNLPDWLVGSRKVKP